MNHYDLDMNSSRQLAVVFWEVLGTLGDVNWLEEARSPVGSPWEDSYL